MKQLRVTKSLAPRLCSVRCSSSPSGRLPVSSRKARRISHRCKLELFRVLTRRNAFWECTAPSSIRQAALIFDKPSLQERLACF